MKMPISVMGGQIERRSFSLPDHEVMEMPNLSPTMEKGNIKEWNVKVGDQIQPGDVLCGIETDKAVVDFEMQEEGYVAKLLFDAGTKDIPLGTPLAIIVESEADIAAFANYDGSGGAAAAPSTPAAPAQEAASTSAPVAAASAASYPEHIALEMPNLSPTMEKVSKSIRHAFYR